jgi:hypothetical protein
MENAEDRINAVPHATVSRRNFLKGVGATLTALTVTAVNPVAEGRAYAASALQGLTDLDILNFALTLEHLEATFYRMAVASGVLRGPRLIGYLTSIRDHEIAHVNTLTQVIQQLGGTPVRRQAHYNFGSMRNQDVILRTAETLEGVGVGAYTGAAALIKNKATLLPAAASIEQVEARHYGAIRILRGRNPAPDAFGQVLTVAEVTKAVAPILGS